uniref:Uncharacterized protein n=1 Tax=viral metagenome TaxID=1070528 RepID=A0A6H1ZTD7_9ZZZZ
MTLEEAIERLRILHSSPLLYETGDYRDAVRLGIEALKLIKQNRECGWAGVELPLAGETKK